MGFSSSEYPLTRKGMPAKAFAPDKPFEPDTGSSLVAPLANHLHNRYFSLAQSMVQLHYHPTGFRQEGQ
jgi:hypothetical protein